MRHGWLISLVTILATAAWAQNTGGGQGGSAGGGSVITVNGGSNIGSPTNIQSGNGITQSNPSGNNVEADWYAATQTMFAQKWDTCGNGGISGSFWGSVWFATLTSATAAQSASPAWPNFCELTFTDTATNPSGVLLTTGDTPTLAHLLLPPLNAHAGWEIQIRFSLSTTATQRMYIGVGSVPTAAAPGNNWMGLRYDTGASDTTFVFETATTSPSTLAYTGVSIGYHTFRMWSPVVGQINMTIDAGSAYCFTTSATSPGCAGGNSTSANIPSTAETPFIEWENLSATTAVTFLTTGAYFQATGLAR